MPNGESQTTEELLNSPELMKIGREVSCRVGQSIFKEGEEDNRFYVILEGLVAIKKKSGEGADRVIAEIGPGEFFGENALLGKTLKPASAEVVQAAKLITVSYEDFQQLIADDARAGVKLLLTVLELVGRRLSRTNSQLMALATVNKLIHLYRSDVANLGRAVVERMLALTKSVEGAVFLFNKYDRTYRALHTSHPELDTPVLKKIDPKESGITEKEGMVYLVGAMEEAGVIVLRKKATDKPYTDDQLRLLILVAEQLGHALEGAANRAAEKAKAMLSQKKIVL